MHVSREGGEVVVVVTDDGKGGATVEGGTGLRGLIDRLAVLDGRLERRRARPARARAWRRTSRSSPGSLVAEASDPRVARHPFPPRHP